MAGASVTNDVSNPRAFVFPAGTTIPAGGYLMVYCNGLVLPTAAPPFNSGYALNGAGGGVFLFKPLTNGGGLLDSVNFGNQITNFSIGRTPNGTGAFVLNTRTRGALNSAAATVQVTNVKINEWLSDGLPGWLELYNTSTTPATLGGNYLTDDFTDRRKALIPPLSFLAGSGAGRWRQIIADNDTTAAPNHVNFFIEGGEGLALFTPSGTLTDSVVSSPQATGLTEGRFTDGTANIVTLTPTPGAANAQPASNDTDGDGLPDAWELAHGLNPNSAADATLDGDFDDLENFIEFAFNLNPQLADAATSSATSGLPTASLVDAAGNLALEVTFLRRKPPGGSTLTYTAQFSPNLAAWSGGGVPSVVSVDAEWERVTVRDSVTAGTGRRFVRLLVTSP